MPEQQAPTRRTLDSELKSYASIVDAYLMLVLELVISEKLFCVTGNPPDGITQGDVERMIVADGGEMKATSNEADYLIEGPHSRSSHYPSNKQREAWKRLIEWKENGSSGNRPIEILSFEEFLKINA